ncbi:MAG: OmpA family protein [Alphaproteobacteria bacterium]|nr:OmpA family protein [Alphaproteobacteria bacterium]
MRKFALLATLTAAALTATSCASRRATETPVAPPTETPPAVQPQQPSGPAPGSIEDFRVQAGSDRVFFALDSADLSPQARSILERQAQWLRRYPSVRVLLAGNCDERGTREYNLALGSRRANAARAYLVSLGVEAARVETTSNGKELPMDPRSNEEAWAVNRNAHTQIISGAIS